jgi:predicted ATPase
VLIGENGSGKSSLIEAFEILRKATEPDFLSKLSHTHGGASTLLRAGSTEIRFCVHARVADVETEYEFVLTLNRAALSVRDEDFRVHWRTLGPWSLLHREHGQIQFPQVIRWNDEHSHGTALAGGTSFPLPSDSLMFAIQPTLSRLGDQVTALEEASPQTLYDGFARLLARLHVQQPFAIRPYWASRELGERFSLRDTVMLAPAPSLGRSGQNLVSCFHKLKNEPGSVWKDTLDLIRLGLGEDVEDIVPDAAGGGKMDLALRLRGHPVLIYSTSLSDGQLAYLAFVALSRLPGEASVIALDEPDAHLHPHLVMRVLAMLEDLAEQRPVVLATHSDRLLDALPDPLQSVVLCELNRDRETELRRPNKEALERWLQHYRGLGDMRAGGVDKLVVTERD